MRTEDRLAILMTCHNRNEKTINCLRSLIGKKPNSVDFTVFLVDDGSTDGTAENVHKLFPDTVILEGDGNLFWNKGMNLAFSTAVNYNFDFYLWVNDDVEFYENSIDKLVNSYYELSSKKKDTIVVGPTMDLSRTINTYGGFKKKESIKPFEIERIYLTEAYQQCLVFHGNCVLIPKSVVDLVGVNDPFYQHGYGDIDYSLMAAKAGCICWLSNYPIGMCDRHNESFKFLDTSLPINERLRSLHSKVNHPRRDTMYFSKKFFGFWWPYKYISSDLRVIMTSVKYKMSKHWFLKKLLK